MDEKEALSCQGNAVAMIREMYIGMRMRLAAGILVRALVFGVRFSAMMSAMTFKLLRHRFGPQQVFQGCAIVVVECFKSDDSFPDFIDATVIGQFAIRI